jgi:hypothetical protein
MGFERLHFGEEMANGSRRQGSETAILDGTY